VHTDDAAHLDLLARADVDDGGAPGDRALVDADVGELPVGAVLELEGERHDGLCRVAGERHGRLVLFHVQGRVLHIRGAGQQGADGIQEGLDGLVLVGRAHEHRRQLAADRPGAQGRDQQLPRDLPLLEGRLHELVGEHGRRLDHLRPLRRRFIAQLGGDFSGTHHLAVFSVEVQGLHVDEIDDALEVHLQADRDLQGHGVVAELRPELGDHAGRVGPAAVALVDEGDAGNLVALHLLVHGDRLGLDASHGAQHEDRAVEHPQGALHLDGEVHVPGGVDEVDLMAEPFAEGGRGGDRDPPLPLELHGVHRRADAVLALDIVDRMDALGVEEDALRQGGFPGVDVGADADVPDLLDVAFHGPFPGVGIPPAVTEKKTPRI